MKKELLFIAATFTSSLLFTACGGSSTTTATSCATGDNDFYVVENAACAVNAGKLSRINPDAVCKEEILTGLDCPIDFVLNSDKTFGYLSVRTNNAAEGSIQPGQIYQVNMTTKIATSMNSGGFFRSIVSPAGLFLLDNLTDAEQTLFCGGNTVIRDILFIADEGTASGGTVWGWCINTSDFDESLTLQALMSITSDGIENPRGVVVPDRLTAYVTAHTTGDADGVVVSKAWDSGSAPTVVATGFSLEIKDIALNAAETGFLVMDAGTNNVTEVIPGVSATAVQADLGGPRDILVRSTTSSFISEFDDGDIVNSALLGGAATNISTGISLSSPDGLAQ